MQPTTLQLLESELKQLKENLDFLKELKSANAEARMLREKKIQIMHNLRYILEYGGEIVGAELSQEWHKNWNECKAIAGREFARD